MEENSSTKPKVKMVVEEEGRKRKSRGEAKKRKTRKFWGM